MRRNHRDPRHSDDPAITVTFAGVKLDEDFELFSDRMEDAVEVENLIHDLVSIHDAEVAVDFS